MGKAPKRSRKFASSGELKRTIDARRKHQKAKKAIIVSKKKRETKRDLKGKEKQVEVADENDEEEEDDPLESNAEKWVGPCLNFCGVILMNSSQNQIHDSWRFS